MGSRLGSEKRAAAVAGIALADWQRLRASGRKRCYTCCRWLPTMWFGADRSRPDGAAGRCRKCTCLRKNELYRIRRDA